MVAISARSAYGCSPPPDVVAVQPTTQALPSNFLLGVMYSETTDVRGPVVSNRNDARVPLFRRIANVDLHEPLSRDRVPGARFTLAMTGIVTVDEIGPADSEAPPPPIALGAELREYEDPCFGAGNRILYGYRTSEDAIGIAVYDDDDRPVFASLGGAPVEFTVEETTEQCFSARSFDLAGNFSGSNDLVCTSTEGCSCRNGAGAAAPSISLAVGLLLLVALCHLRPGRKGP